MNLPLHLSEVVAAPAATTQDLITAMLHQMVSSPAAIIVIIGLSVAAYVMEIWPNFNSRFIPIVCIIGGPFVYPCFCRFNTVPEYFPYPIAVFIVNGLVCGLLASAIYKWLIKLLLAKFAPATLDNPNKTDPPKS